MPFLIEIVPNNKRVLLFNARETITQGLIQGQSVAKMSKSLADAMGKSYHQAETLIRTETNNFHAQADVRAYEAAGVEEYEFVATLDSRTSEICASLDGKHFPIKEAKTGVNYPPMHPRCRSTTVEYDPEDAADWAAGGQPMPENMTYEEWTEEQDESAGVMHDYGDYLAPVLGSAKENDKEELEKIIFDVKSKGGDFIFVKESRKMVTNIIRGQPATIEIYEGASIAAVKHEYRHFLDDLSNNNPGFAYYLRNPEVFFAYEKRGYQEELEIAKKLGYNDIEEKILDEIEQRRKEIFNEK